MAHIERIWGTRSGHAAEIVENVVQYLKEHPANYQGQVDTLLELLYQAFTEYNSAETPEFRKHDYSGALWFFRIFWYKV